MVPHQGGLSSHWSLIKVASHHSGLSSEWPLIIVVSHQGGLSSVWSFIRVTSHQGGPSSGWSLIRLASHHGWSLMKSPTVSGQGEHCTELQSGAHLATPCLSQCTPKPVMITQCTPKPISLYCDQCRKAKAPGNSSWGRRGVERGWCGGGVCVGKRGQGNSIIICAYLQREACSP